MKSYIKRIIVICIAELLLRWIIGNHGDLIFLVACNILVLGIIFYTDLKEICSQIGKHIVWLGRYTPGIIQKATKLIHYLFQQYILILSFFLVLVSIFDRLFMNYFYLPLWLCVLFLVISVLVLLPEIIEYRFFFAWHNLQKVEFSRGCIVVFLLSMLVTFRTLPLYQTYFYGLISTLIVSVILFLFFENKPIRTLLHSWFFQIIGWLTLISSLVFIWNIFPQIKHACTITQKIYIDRPIYLDKIDKTQK